MNKVTLSKVAKVELSSIDKNFVSTEKPVKLCNFTDVYYNWAIIKDIIDSCMDGSVKTSEFQKFVLKKGQVAITKDSETRDDIGISCYISDDFNNAVLGYHCALITPNSCELSGKYLNALLHTTYARKCFSHQAGGSGQRFTLTKDAIENIVIPLPSLDEQKRIGNFFSDIDKKIQNNKKQIQILESLAQTIYDYWFMQFDFPNEEGKPYKISGGEMVWSDLLKRKIPKGWKVQNIMSLGTWSSASQPPKSQFSYIPQKGYVRFIQNRDYDSDEHLTYVPLNNSTKLCNEYDIMIDKYGDAGRVRYGLSGAYNVALGKFSTNDSWAQEYIRMSLKQDGIFKYLHNACLASTRASLNETVLQGVFIPFPEDSQISIIKKYEALNKSFIDKILHLKKEIKEYSGLRDFLLPLLINGQISFKS